MKRKSSLSDLADDQDMSVRKMIISNVEGYGSVKEAASHLHVSEATIWNWLRNHHYSIRKATLVVKRDD